jgi:hypothetical protein
LKKLAAKVAALAVAAVALVTGGVMLSSQDALAATTVTITPTADAYTTSLSGSTNFGTATSLLTGTSTYRSYMKFDLSGVTGTITSAKLRLFNQNSYSSNPWVAQRVTSNTWTETGITHNNRPLGSGAFSTAPSSATSGAYSESTVTSLVTAGQVNTLLVQAATSGTPKLAYDSREAGNDPQLVVTFDGGGPVPDTTPPSVPTNVTAAASGTDTINVAWSASVDAVGVTGYGVYRDGSTTPVAVTGTTYAHTGLAPSTSHTYQVDAVDAAGNRSAKSTMVGATTGSIPDPDPGPGTQPTFPIRAAFYYPWFPEAWDQAGIEPFTKYTPVLGYYDLDDGNVTINKHVDAMKYGDFDAGIASWWGPGHHTDTRIDNLLDVGNAKGFKWTVYHEQESQGNPPASAITSDLTYLRDNYVNGPDGASWLRVDNKPVIFVYADGTDACSMVTRWKQANTLGFYLVLKVFPGYATCADQPDSWHQYAPAQTDGNDVQNGYSYSIAPGFWLTSESAPRFERSLSLFTTNVQNMAASDEPWHLVISFNEWGENSIVEEAVEWQDANHGAYLEVLHDNPTGGSLPPPPPPPPPPGSVFVAAGDIACEPPYSVNTNSCRHGAVSDMILALNPAAVLGLGDLQYEEGSASQFTGSYNPTWGRFKAKTLPAVGNHEYLTSNASGYFGYFGAAAGAPTQGWYTKTVDGWGFLSVNSNCSKVGGCNDGDPQYEFFESYLNNNPPACTVAFMHHPRWTSGSHANSIGLTQLWNLFHAKGVDIVLAGHNHVYERFSPLGGNVTTSTVNPPSDPNGIRYWVVGTGGKNHTSFAGSPLTNEVARNSDTYGFLKITAGSSNNYTWQFVNEPGSAGSFTESGSANCR